MSSTHPARAPHDRWILALGPWLILALGLFAYAGDGSRELHYDDTHAIQANRAIHTFYVRTHLDTRTDLDLPGRLRRARVASEATARALYDANRFRILTNASFAWTYTHHPFAHTDDPAERAQHLRAWYRSNVTIHLANALLVFAFAYLTLTAPAFPNPTHPASLALLTAAAFVTHPLTTQAVTYLSQRAESLCALAYLLALTCHAALRRRSPTGHAPHRCAWLPLLTLLALALTLLALRQGALDLGHTAWVTLGCLVGLVTAAWVGVRRGLWDGPHAALTLGSFAGFVLAAGCKEVGVTAPAAVIAWDLLFVPSSRRRRLRVLAPWLLLAVGGVALAFVFGRTLIEAQLLREIDEGGRQGLTLGPWDYARTQLNVGWTYLRLALLPYGQSLDHDVPVVRGAWGAPQTYVALLSAAAWLTALGLIARRGRRARVPSFALLFALIVLSPSSSVLVLADVLVEHRTYLPLVGVLLTVAVVLERLTRALPSTRQRQTLWAVTLILGVGLATLTRARNAVWATEASLWSDVTAKYPDKPRGWTNLGLAYQNQEPWRLTDPRSQRSAEGLPFDLPDGTTLVVPTATLGAPPTLFETAHADREPRPGGPERAVDAYREALARDPDYSKALNNLALVSIARARAHRTAAQVLIERARANPEAHDPEAVRALIEAWLRRAQGWEVEARDAFLRVVELRPHDGVVMNNLGNLYASAFGDYAEAERWVRRSLQQSKTPPGGWAVLGDVVMVQGRLAWEDDDPEAARAAWERARVAYERYLLDDPRGPFRARARARLRDAEALLSGDASPADVFGGDD